MDASSRVTICDPCNLLRGTYRSFFKVVSARDAILYYDTMSAEQRSAMLLYVYKDVQLLKCKIGYLVFFQFGYDVCVFSCKTD